MLPTVSIIDHPDQCFDVKLYRHTESFVLIVPVYIMGQGRGQENHLYPAVYITAG